MTAERELPRYQCHKKVWALKIAEVKIDPVAVVPADEGYGTFRPADGWIDRYRGGVIDDMGYCDMGYYVVYDDGYASWSPTKAFEDGYARI